MALTIVGSRPTKPVKQVGYIQGRSKNNKIGVLIQFFNCNKHYSKDISSYQLSIKYVYTRLVFYTQRGFFTKPTDIVDCSLVCIISDGKDLLRTCRVWVGFWSSMRHTFFIVCKVGITHTSLIGSRMRILPLLCKSSMGSNIPVVSGYDDLFPRNHSTILTFFML